MGKKVDVIKYAGGNSIVVISNWHTPKIQRHCGEANMYAKSNSVSDIKEMMEIVTNKIFAENYAKEHSADSKFGWY